MDLIFFSTLHITGKYKGLFQQNTGNSSVRCTVTYCRERGASSRAVHVGARFSTREGREGTIHDVELYENYASICSSKNIQNEQHVHRHQSSLTKKENAQGGAGRRENKRNRIGKYIYIPYR